MKYLFVDGNNLAIRNAFSNAELKNNQGIPTGVHYGVLNSLIMLKTKFPTYQFLISWDSKSRKRVEMAEAAVQKGLIKSGYKANRKKDEQPQPLLDFYAQAPYLKKGIEQTGIPQIRLEDEETDDVIASYCKLLRDNNEIICVTSDDDYMVLLHDNVKIFDGMKDKLTTKEEWEKENGIKVEQYIHCGALSGDDSDNIHGVPGIGEKTALKIIQEYGSWEKAVEAYKKMLQPYREQYPDLSVPGLTFELEFTRLKDLKTKTGKDKYPEITIGMPFTGVALAIEDDKIKDKIPKTTISAVMFEERIRLAYSLKKMDDSIPNLPEIKQGQLNKEKLLEYFNYYDIESLKDAIDMFQ